MELRATAEKMSPQYTRPVFRSEIGDLEPLHDAIKVADTALMYGGLIDPVCCVV